MAQQNEQDKQATDEARTQRQRLNQRMAEWYGIG
jgi:hypothetical protein